MLVFFLPALNPDALTTCAVSVWKVIQNVGFLRFHVNGNLFRVLVLGFNRFTAFHACRIVVNFVIMHALMLKEVTRLVFGGRFYVSGGGSNVVGDDPTCPRFSFVYRVVVGHVGIGVAFGKVSDVRCDVSFEYLPVPIGLRVFYRSLLCLVFRVLFRREFRFHHRDWTFL